MNSNKKLRKTLCISTQVGCSMGCMFCATGKLGFKRNLNLSEIIDQLILSERISGSIITNIVFMGMGEPMLNLNNIIKSIEIFTHDKFFNLSRNNITVSTVGIPNKIKELADSNLRIKLALSLHATTDKIRESIVPAAKNFKLNEILESLDYNYKKSKQLITYEYILFDSINDSLEDAKRLSKISRRIPSKINIIPYNNISFILDPEDKFILKSSPENRIKLFMKELQNNGVIAIRRLSAGDDIEAACGQLASGHNKTSK